MLLNNFKSIVRDLWRNKLLAAINVLGLSVGIGGCLIIYLITSYELSFDTFQEDRDRIYRIYSKFDGSFEGTNVGVPTALPIFIKDHCTGIDALTNFHTLNCDITIPVEDAESRALGNYNKIIIAAPDYFDVFNYYEWVAGDPVQSLAEPFRVVLTESRARTYFGDSRPATVIGREVHYQDSLIVTVSGIVKDIKQNTDLDFTDFISFITVERSWLEDNKLQLNTWNAVNSSSQLFVKLSDGITCEDVEAQVVRIPEMYETELGKWDEWRPASRMQPLSSIHLNSKFGIFDHSRPVMDKSTLFILIAVAALLLIMAVINFINLETAQASRRARGVAIRKVLGSSRRKLIFRFLFESFILCILAAMLAMCWTELTFAYFPEYIPEGLVFDPASWTMLMFSFSCAVVVPLLAGLYPAFIIAAYKPAIALRNQVRRRGGTSHSEYIRKGLTIAQFSFSQILLTGSFIVGLQLYFMANKELGFDADSVVCVNTPEDGSEIQRQAFGNELRAVPEVKAFAVQMSAPVADATFSQEMSFFNGKETLKHNFQVKMADTSYLAVYGLELLAGRNLLPLVSMKELLINEASVRFLGFTDPKQAVGQTLDENKTIVGVLKDFHTASMHQPIEPIVVAYSADESGFAIRLNMPKNKAADVSAGLSRIETAWNKIYPDEPFRADFLGDTIRRFYENERRAGKLSVMATIIALVISSLGLFGHTTFITLQRTKEIGIRKVLGATVNSIVFLFSKDFLKLVLIAFIFSTPFAYYLMDNWLNNFAYRINMRVWIFAASAIMLMIVAFATICFRTLHAARADPVKSLRYE